MSRPRPPHCDAAHAAITAELVRLTLPHHISSDRPALELALPEPKVQRIRRKPQRASTRRR